MIDKFLRTCVLTYIDKLTTFQTYANNRCYILSVVVRGLLIDDEITGVNNISNNSDC